MNVRSKYFWFLVTLVVGYGLFEYYRPKPLDWTATYSNKDKIPFGTRATYELLPNVFDSQKISSVRLPIYNQLTETKLPQKSNYVFVNQSFTADRNDTKVLLKHVGSGNHVFISAYEFPDSLLRTLGIEAKLKAPSLRDTALVINFVNPRFRTAKGYVFKDDDGRNYFNVKPTAQASVLAKNARNEPIFVKVTYGKGAFYLHTLPLALTNFYALDETQSDFAFKSFSYLPLLPVFWDEYQKQGRFGENEQSVLRYIMTEPALRWAYYIALFGLVLYAVFAGKRTQRVIPVLTPPQNTSLEFTQTIGRMYFQQGDHAHLARRKIQHLFAYIRDRFGLRTNVIDDELQENIAHKAGLPLTEIQSLFAEISHVEASPRLSEYGLQSLNRKIEDFRAKTRG